MAPAVDPAQIPQVPVGPMLCIEELLDVLAVNPATAKVVGKSTSRVAPASAFQPSVRNTRFPILYSVLAVS